MWALAGMGVKAVIAPYFGDIFYNNCFQNGLLPVTLPIEDVEQLADEMRASPGNARVTVDLENCQVVSPTGRVIPFKVDARRQHAMLNGLDDIAQTMSHKDEIAAWQAPTRPPGRGCGCERLKPLHVFAALLIVAMWGLNFTVIRFGLDEFAPFTFVDLALPAGRAAGPVRPKPAISWGTLAGIGGFMFGGQFVFLFFAMQAGLPPGLTSVLVQLQGPLTVVLAALFLREHATRGQWLGLAVATVGVVLIARSVEGSASLFAIGLALLSALTWATGNLFFRSARGVSMFAVTAWACVLPPMPLALAALILEGPDQLLAPILAPTWKGWFALLYTVVPVMWLGYLIWGTLLRTYPAAKVGPISLLVPCVALGFAAWLVGEPIGGLRLFGVVVVLGGVAMGLFASVRRLR